MSNQFLEAAIDTAIEASGILLSEFGRPPKVSRKGKLDLVTQADRQSEHAIVSDYGDPSRSTPFCRKEEARRPARGIVGSSTLLTAQRTLSMAIRVSPFQ
jgi:hypothetical protein